MFVFSNASVLTGDFANLNSGQYKAKQKKKKEKERSYLKVHSEC